MTKNAFISSPNTETFSVLGVTVHNVSFSEVRQFVVDTISGSEFRHIVTINPDLIMMAQRNPEFLDALNRADLTTIDGVGIYLPAILQKKNLKGRVSGSDLFEIILEVAEETSTPIFLLVNQRGLSTFHDMSLLVKKRFPNIELFGYDVDTVSVAEIESGLEKARCFPIVLSNFGGALQEISLAKLRTLSRTKVRLVVGVGGAFDFFTGKQKRAPFLVRRFGFEWLWRFILQPRRRLRRTWEYVFVYSILCFREAFASAYRSPKKTSPPLRTFHRNIPS
ncbi:MAG: WecB/TagA/CpsF family glycosyltransferase [Candidatus Moraniibacteriota bacterium]|nr:MAG: WecB/TagA/CpsF family glycosyltransferase [Candidatus Moranbacteria bacterium]